MKINVAVCSLALLSVPILVSAQGASPLPVLVSPAATPIAQPAHVWPGRPSFSPADLTQLKALGAKMRVAAAKQHALMESSRAKLFGSVTPGHRKLVAQIIGELAMSSKPDAKGAAAQVDAVLSPSEKKAIIAANVAARAQMANLRKQNGALRGQFEAFRKHLMSERPINASPTAQLPPMAQGPTAQLPPRARMNSMTPHLGWGNQTGQQSRGIHKNPKTRTPDAGWYLIVAARFGPHMHGMMMRPGSGMGSMHGMGGMHMPLGPGPVVPPSH